MSEYFTTPGRPSEKPAQIQEPDRSLPKEAPGRGDQSGAEQVITPRPPTGPDEAGEPVHEDPGPPEVPGPRHPEEPSGAPPGPAPREDERPGRDPAPGAV